MIFIMYLHKLFYIYTYHSMIIIIISIYYFLICDNDTLSIKTTIIIKLRFIV